MIKKGVNRRRTSLRLKEDVYKAVEKESRELGISMNGYISMVLHREVNKTR